MLPILVLSRSVGRCFSMNYRDGCSSVLPSIGFTTKDDIQMQIARSYSRP